MIWVTLKYANGSTHILWNLEVGTSQIYKLTFECRLQGRRWNLFDENMFILAVRN